MFESPYHQYTLGINHQHKAIYVAQLSFCDKKFKIELLSRLPLVQTALHDHHVKPVYMVGDIPLSSLIDRIRAATALSTAEVLVRPLEIDLIKEKDIDAVFGFQAEPLLPYPLEEALLNKIKLSQKENTTQLTLISARKSRLHKHIEEWQALGVEPEVVSCVPAALATFSKYCLTTDSPYIVLHLGDDEITAILAKNGKLMGSYSFPEGMQAIEKALITDLHPSNISEVLHAMDFGAISNEKTAVLYALLQQMRLGVARIVYALCKQSKGEEIEHILVTGPGSVLNNLHQLLTKDLMKQVVVAESSSFDVKIETDRGVVHSVNTYAIPIGLAIALHESEKGIDFRKEEFAYPQPWKRIKRPLAALFSLSICCAVLAYFFGQMWIGYQEDNLKERYGQLLIEQSTRFEELENGFRKKNALPAIQEGEVIALKDFTIEDIEQRLEHFRKTLEAMPETFPLQANTPRVSDVLAWLSTHPNMIKEEGDEAMRIENFSYNMVKRPDQSKKNEKYQVKIELDFTSPTPKLAREFHDALIAPNDFVDPKGEVKWSANRGKYHTSFFLKDKTVYPSLQGG